MVQLSQLPFKSRALGHTLLLAEHLLGTRLFAWLLGPIRELTHKRTLRSLEAIRQPSKAAVLVRSNLSAAEFHRDYFRTSKPVVLAGAASDWPCCKRWNLDYFANTYSKTDALLVNSNGLTSRRPDTKHEFISLKNLVAGIRSGHDKYLRFSPLVQNRPELADALDTNWLRSMQGPGTFGHAFHLFIGGQGAKTLLHADQPCNLYVQVSGRKKWTLFLPSDSLCLYPEVTNTAYVKSPIDLDAPDEARFPLFKYATAYEVILEPGDILYVPPHVWHQVENLTETVAVGYRFSSLAAALRSSIVFSLIRILSTNPPVWKTRKLGKLDTNLIWAHAGGTVNSILKERERRVRATAATTTAGPEL